jgi:hypothetical protein
LWSLNTRQHATSATAASAATKSTAPSSASSDYHKLHIAQIAISNNQIAGLLPHNYPVVDSVNRDNFVGLLVYDSHRRLLRLPNGTPLSILEVVEVAIPDHRRHASPVVSYHRSPGAPLSGATDPFQYTVAAYDGRGSVVAVPCATVTSSDPSVPTVCVGAS